MSEVLTGVNGKMIRWARERYNMSSAAAAQAIGVDVQRYENWENSEDYPTYSMLKKISNVFQKPSALFFFPDPPVLPDIKGELRTLPENVTSLFSKHIIQQFEKAQVYQLNLRELYGNRFCILQNRTNFPTNIVDLAQYIRNYLAFSIKAQKQCKNTKNVFEDFRSCLYDHGIYVFKDSFGDNSVSGLCLYDVNYPIIMINNAMSFARQNFTLFHELYHLLSNTNGTEIIRDDFYVYLNNSQTTIEKNCDTFANEFLIPTDDFVMEIKNRDLTDNFIAELAKIYSVSKEAIMYKLYTLKLITSEDYNALKEVFYGEAIRTKQVNNDVKGGGNYYYTKLAYLGSKYTRTVFSQYFSGKIDSYKASEMLNSKVDHLSKLETAFFREMK